MCSSLFTFKYRQIPSQKQDYETYLTLNGMLEEKSIYNKRKQIRIDLLS